MKRCIKDCLIVGIIGILTAVIIFLLFNSEFLAINENTNSFLLLSIAVSIYVLIKLFKVKKLENAKDNYCYCGHLSAIGAAGIFIIAFILSLLVNVTGIIFYIFISLFFLFMVWMLGGLVCLLYSLNDCHNNDCNNSCQDRRYVDDNNEEYSRNQYNRNNEYMYKERRR